MNSTLDKLVGAARHMVDAFIDRLPALVLAIAVFVLFSQLAARLIRKAASKHRQNLALVFARLIDARVWRSLAHLKPFLSAHDRISVTTKWSAKFLSPITSN
jgi:uncharacterized membrane protein YoaK (UPF0700 family)